MSSGFIVKLHEPGVYRNGIAVTHTLYDVGSGDSDYLLNGSLKLEVNKAGSFEFDILPSHSCYSLLRRYVHYISIIEKDVEEEPEPILLGDDDPGHWEIEDPSVVFYGRILSMNLSFNGTKHVTCEGLLANLLDCPMYYPGAEKTDDLYLIRGTPGGMLHTGLKAYRNLIRTDIKEGVIHNSANDYSLEDIDVSGGTSVGDFITGELVEAHGGFLKMHYYKNWKHDIFGVLDWLPDPSMGEYSETTINQRVEFQENMLDLSAECEDDEITTGIIATWEDKDNEKHWITTTATDVDDSSETIMKPTVVGAQGGLSAIGIKIQELPGAKTQSTAVSYANNYYNKYCSNYVLSGNSGSEFDSYTVRALDLHFVDNLSKHKIWLYSKVRIICEPFSIDKQLVCSSVEISIDSPELSSYTFSVYRPKASGNDKVLTRQLKRKKL